MRAEPKWKRAERFDRVATLELKARAEEIFPLLCPVREYDWIPDWRCEMVYSDSGTAEKDAVFRTRFALGSMATWTCITYEPPRFIEYLVVLGLGAVMRLSLRLEDGPGGSTRLQWAMRFTVARRLSRLAARGFSQAGFDAMMALRKHQLEDYFSAKRG
jgi:hypothetical protein